MTDSLMVERRQCPACGGAQLQDAYRQSYEGPRMRSYLELAYHGRLDGDVLAAKDFVLAECRDCGCWFQSNILTEAGAARLYNEWIDPDMAAQTDQVQGGDDGYLVAALLFARRLIGNRQVRMLDYGAGFGRACLLARGFGMQPEALEFSDERVRAMAEVGIAALRPAELADREYDFVFMNQVLEHLPDPFEILQRVHAVLRPGGLFFVGVPNCRGLKQQLQQSERLDDEVFKRIMRPCSALQHINSFTNPTLKRICLRAGFEPVFRPLTFLGGSVFGYRPTQWAKTIVRPFYHQWRGTHLFWRKPR